MSSRGGRVSRIARLHREMRTSGRGPEHHALGVFIGVFVGCLPLYGLHFPLCLVLARLFKVNVLTTYVAAHVNNPLSGPFLVIAEIELGSMVRRGEVWGLSALDLKGIEWKAFLGDLMIGSVIIGIALGAILALVVWLTVLKRGLSFQRWDTVLRVSDRFLTTGITNWEFVRGKLRWDPIYFALLDRKLLEGPGALVDLGCGRGIVLGLALEAQLDRPPGRFIGVETRKKTARKAELALPEAEIIVADLRELELPEARVVLLLDVLHYLPREAQEGLLERVVAALEEDGRLIIREADAAGGAGFIWTRLAEQLRSLGRLSWPSFRFRSRSQWQTLLEELGLEVENFEADEGTPFANNVFVARKRGGS